MTTLKKNYGPLVVKIILLLVFCTGPAKLVLPLSGAGSIFVHHAALAKGGGDGGGDGGGSGSGDSGSDGDGEGDSGSSGPGSGSDSGSDGDSDSSGPGSGNDSGSSGPGSGNNSGSDRGNSGSGKDKSSRDADDIEASDRGGIDSGKFIDLLKASLFRGAVVKKRKSRSLLEIIYRDGWKEKIVSGRYILLDPKNRIVVKRTATRADKARMKAAFKSKNRWEPPETRN